MLEYGCYKNRHVLCQNNGDNKSMSAVHVCADELNNPLWTIEEIRLRFVDAFKEWRNEHPKRRKNLRLVHFKPVPEVRKFGKAGERGCVFELKIASGAKFPLAAIPSEQARQEFVASCRQANCFVPAITPILEEKTWQLLERMKKLVRRMVKSFKHMFRRHRKGHEGRFSRQHCNRAAARAVMI